MQSRRVTPDKVGVRLSGVELNVVLFYNHAAPTGLKLFPSGLLLLYRRYAAQLIIHPLCLP